MSDKSVSTSSRGLVWLGRVARLVLLFGILGGAAWIAYYWMSNPLTAQRRKPQKQARLVSVRTVERRSHVVTVRAMGTVVPERSVSLSARVSGEVVEVSPDFQPGGRFEAGQQVLRIDPTDYRLAVARAEADLAKAEADLSVELGQQSVARREYELLKEDIKPEDAELVLRKPQLAMARAAVAVRRAALEEARLDLSRTSITSPFNAMVRTRQVNLGAQVGASTVLADLVGTDTYWVEVSVPVDQLNWIDIPGYNAEVGSTVRIYQRNWPDGRYRTGRVVRLRADVEPQGRMARLQVAVDDPLHLASDPQQRQGLLLDSYVRVEIRGRTAGDVVAITRTSLRDGSMVWVMNEQKQLVIRPVTIAWSDAETVLVETGLETGDRIVTSDIQAPVEGLTLRTADDAPAKATRPHKAEDTKHE